MRRVIVVPSSIIRSRIARVGTPPAPAPRMIRRALYWARLNPCGSTVRAIARRTTDAVRRRAMAPSCPRERNGFPWRISPRTPVEEGIGITVDIKGAMTIVAMISNAAAGVKVPGGSNKASLSLLRAKRARRIRAARAEGWRERRERAREQQESRRGGDARRVRRLDAEQDAGEHAPKGKCRDHTRQRA